MNSMTVTLFDLWAARWEDLLSYRRDLIHWKKALKTSERDYQRTKLDAYQEEISCARYAIQQLEYYIAELKGKLESDPYCPYDVLRVSQDACGKEIFQAYSGLRQEAEQACVRWLKLLDQADTSTKHVIFSNNLEKARFILRQIELAYEKLKAVKPYYPGVPHHKKLLGMSTSKHYLLKLHSDHQILDKKLHHH